MNSILYTGHNVAAPITPPFADSAWALPHGVPPLQSARRQVLRNYVITRRDWAVMAYGATVGASAIGYASSGSVAPIVAGAVFGLFFGAVIVTMHKLSGFGQRPKTLLRIRMQKCVFLGLILIVSYVLLKRALTRDWFEFGVLLFIAVPFAFLSHDLIVRLLIRETPANHPIHGSGGTAVSRDGRSTPAAP